ncbi:MAG: (d)CMP kinase [Chloroflexi bacterium]|nr:(d)CMP kinase [Chloroflexota bacterium]
MSQPPVIAIDGPAASGKTTVGRRLAARLGYRFLDTGLMYRAVAWAALAEGIDLEEAGALSALARRRRLRVAFGSGDEARIWVDGREVTPLLADAGVEEAVSPVARVAGVRKALVAQQRRIAREGPIVMAGRDIGTVVVPGARLKVFLTASEEERARRRVAELKDMGRAAGYSRVLEELERRDRMDSTRAVSPLRPAPDAQIIATDGKTVDDVVELILSLWEPR